MPSLNIKRLQTGVADPETGVTVATVGTMPAADSIAGVNISASATEDEKWLRLSAAATGDDTSRVSAGRYVYVGGEIREIKAVTSDLKMLLLNYALETPVSSPTQLKISTGKYRSVTVQNAGEADGILQGIAFPAGAVRSFNSDGGQALAAISYDATGTTFIFDIGL